MELNSIHLLSLLVTIGVVIGSGIYSARSVKSAEGYSLNGRAAGVPLIAGSIAGTVIGGGATVGTAQMAFTLGLSAWWFTLGSGIAFIIMGFFYARPLRRTGLETIPQYLVLNYGKSAGPIVSIISSVGILFSAVASCLPAIQFISAIFHIGPTAAAVVLVLLIAGYVFFGGMKGAGISGLLKMIILWITLLIAGITAVMSLHSLPTFTAVFPAFPWFSLFGKGVSAGLSNLFSLVVGILCTQTYIQAIFSATDSRTATIGAFVAALIVIPVGLPSIAIAMFMHASQPDIAPILALPVYLLQYQPAWLGGIGLAGIVLSLIGSIAGLALGIGTMVARDIVYEIMKVQHTSTVLWANRITVLCVTGLASFIAIVNLDSQVLFWNYMSMALRGGGVFLPLTLAIFAPGRISGGCAVFSMVASTVVAILSATVLHLPFEPLFVGLTVSAVIICGGIIWRAGHHHISEQAGM